eukprot:CAMPEP_0197186456 /NCGR_PEP_ID=MMETSP1423-20130617/13964_1 /TAXON_ID=476441 /ORGANISM="Pseudo-nitzschia heimii, Strain UNC1101" /LENGTH=211 /DNA_ID=CAMNT_0042637783 /DNA_START=40 /DNA_END=675 /DNA_ORIENTATION=-
MITRTIVLVLSSFLVAAVPAVIADDCRTIYDIVCESTGLENFCGLIGATETEYLFDGEEDLTVFAPINEAVTTMDFLQYIHDDKLREVVLFSTHVGIIATDDLECVAGRNRLRMVNGKESRTICEEKIPVFQKGGGNSDEKKPIIIKSDIEACNGVVHMVDTVMLPGGFEEYENSENTNEGVNNENKNSSGTLTQRSTWYAFAALIMMMFQ